MHEQLRTPADRRAKVPGRLRGIGEAARTAIVHDGSQAMCREGGRSVSIERSDEEHTAYRAEALAR